MRPAVLLVGDEPLGPTGHAGVLRAAGYEVTVSDGPRALERLAGRRFDALVTDLVLGGVDDGVALLERARQAHPRLGVIVFGARDEAGPAVRAMRAGAVDYLVKPVAAGILLDSVRRCLAAREVAARGAARDQLELFDAGERIAGDVEELAPDLAYVDDLTRLYNARYLDVALDRELEGRRPFTLLFLDLDRFKAVNDRHGHLSGSRVLVEVGRVLRVCVRDEDVVVRYGGDEYVLLLPGVESSAGTKAAERIRRAVEGHRFLSREGARIAITASIGVASYPEHATGKAPLLDLADRAMYRGKRSGRNVVRVAARDLTPVPAGARERS
jgi:diguanylate cyclase (GGDEF)-like protein